MEADMDKSSCGLWIKSGPRSPACWSKRGPLVFPSRRLVPPPTESWGSDWLDLSLERPQTTSDLRCPGITGNLAARAQPGSASAGRGP